MKLIVLLLTLYCSSSEFTKQINEEESFYCAVIPKVLSIDCDYPFCVGGEGACNIKLLKLRISNQSNDLEMYSYCGFVDYYEGLKLISKELSDAELMSGNYSLYLELYSPNNEIKKEIQTSIAIVK